MDGARNSLAPFLWLLPALLAVAVAAPAGADAVSAVNAVRAQGCGRHAGSDRPLVRRNELDRAGQELARGIALAEAVRSSGYLAKQSRAIHVRNADSRDEIAALLSRQYCKVVTDAALRDVGTFSSGAQTWLVLAQPLISDAVADTAAATDRLLDSVNAARAQARRCGRQRFAAAAPLRRVESLDRAAEAHARDLAASGRLGHDGSDGSMPGERASRAGYRWGAVAENIAVGQTEASEAVATWLASPGHCASLMNARYTETGMALAADEVRDRGILWVQVYAAPQ